MMSVRLSKRLFIALLLGSGAALLPAQTITLPGNPSKPLVPPPVVAPPSSQSSDVRKSEGHGAEAASLQSEIARVRDQIRISESEDAKFTGGLVKALIRARIAILQQTEAMLEQRSKASTFGILVSYTIDGTAFVLPASANDQLRAVEQEIAANQAKIASQEVETARYSGGLVQALSRSTLETLRQTQAMLDEKRVALKYGLPQYVGFHTDSAPPAATTVSKTDARSSPRIPPKPFVPPPPLSDAKIESGTAPQEPPAGKDWRIVSVDTRVTESNNVWSKYAWKLTLRNDSDQPQAFQGTIEFQDRDGFIVDTGRAGNMLLRPKSEEIFTGYALIKAEVASNVARTVAKVGTTK